MNNWLGGLLALAVACGLPGAAQARVERVTVHSPAIEGNLEGNTADRTVFVVLPPSYDKARHRRFPVLYFLHGFTATAEKYMDYVGFDEALAERGAGPAEMIVVVPDSYTRHGGSMYSSSPTTGDFESFIARDLVSWVDGHYRTLAARDARGLGGHSMGGYGTLRIGMNHPEVFSSLYAMSACCLIPRPAETAEARFETMDLPTALAGDFMTQANFAVAAAWSPNPQKPPFFADLGSSGGKPVPLVMAQWAANSPQAMAAQHVPALRAMNAIAMDVGDKDFLFGEDLAMHEMLEKLGVAHSWTIYDGDHGNRVRARFRSDVLPFFARHLDAGARR